MTFIIQFLLVIILRNSFVAARTINNFAPDEICQALLSIENSKVICDKREISNYSWKLYNKECTKEQYLPKWIFSPQDKFAVSKVVVIAEKYKLKISVRGGGHSYVCLSMKKDSLHIDMRSMGDKVVLSQEGGEVYARLLPGTRFYDINRILSSKYASIQGTCPSNGVMGFHLHGGWSPVGDWASSNIERMEMVSHTGEIIDLHKSSTNETLQNLFFGMTKAGSSYGIVTSLTIKLIPKYHYHHIIVRNDPSDLLNIIEKSPTPLFGWVGIMRWDTQFPSLIRYLYEQSKIRNEQAKFM